MNFTLEHSPTENTLKYNSRNELLVLQYEDAPWRLFNEFFYDVLITYQCFSIADNLICKSLNQ